MNLDSLHDAYPGVGIAEVVAKVPRANEHDVASDATEEDPSHAVLVPRPGIAGISKRREAAYRIAKLAQIVVPVPGVAVAKPGAPTSPPTGPE